MINNNFKYQNNFLKILMDNFEFKWGHKVTSDVKLQTFYSFATNTIYTYK